ncbi:hypothetical protein JCM8202v2_001754 [Rhodotorula sphaerocarpa]
MSDALESSPSKRRRLDPPSSLPLHAAPPAIQPAPAPTPSHHEAAAPRPSVPPHLTLWAVASSLRTSTRRLLASLAKRPSSTSPKSQDRYARLWAAYVQQTAALIAALRAAVRVATRGSETKGTRVELRAQAMLAEALVETYEGTEEAGAVAGEADKAITRALAIAASHPSLTPYTTSLTLLHLRLAVAVHKPLKYIKTTLRRLVASLPAIDSDRAEAAPKPQPDPTTVACAVQAASFSSRLEDVAPTEAIGAWRAVKDLARAVGNERLAVVAMVAEARLLLAHEGDLASAERLLAPLHALLGLSAGVPTATEVLVGEERPRPTPPAAWPRQLCVTYRLLWCLVQSQLGRTQEAKDLLKAAHQLLDEPMSEAEKANPDSITIDLEAEDGSPSGTSVAVQVSTHASLYSFAYIVSSVVHFDPLGKSPRAILFAEEGVRALDGQLSGRDAIPVLRSVAEITAHLQHAVLPAVRLRLSLASLATMRSAYSEAETHLLSAFAILRAHDHHLTDHEDDRAAAACVSKVLLGWAHMRMARAARDGADEHDAKVALEAVLERFRGQGREGEGFFGPGTGQTKRVAALSMLMLHLSSSGAAQTAVAGASSPAGKTASGGQDRLTRQLLELIILPDSGPSATAAEDDPLAHSRLLTAVARALTAPTITASKIALSEALSLANATQANYVRVGVLALLANVFVCTRDRESQKMLTSSFKLAVQMGSHKTRARIFPAPAQATPDTYRSVGDVNSFERQARANEVCREFLERDEREARCAAAAAVGAAAAAAGLAGGIVGAGAVQAGG